ncbi:hypothetical protein FRC12_005680, partial [Ceratobasidium sp. 428]
MLFSKRKAATAPTSSGDSRTKQQKLPNTSDDTKLLLRVINNSEESRLRNALASSVNNASPSDLQAIKKSLGPLVA